MVSLEEDITNYRKEKNDKDQQLNRKKHNEFQIDEKLRQLDDRKEVLIGKLEVKLEDMDAEAEKAYFDEQTFLRDELKKEYCKEYNFSYVKETLNKYTKSIEAALKVLEEERRKNREYDNAIQSLEKSKTDREEKERFLEQTKSLLTEINAEYVEKLYGWRKENKELKLTDETMVKASREVNNFEYSKSFEDVLMHIRTEYNNFQAALNQKLYAVRGEKAETEKKAEEKRKEMEEWKDKKDPEPYREVKVNKSREKLAVEKIPFIPLYKAVDFCEGVSDGVKGKIEEALLDMGLLDALIIPDSYRQKVMALDSEGADKYLFPAPKFLMHDLSEILKGEVVDEESISAEDIDNVLKSILIDENKDSVYINEKGDYSIGILRGKVTKEYVPRFIGSAARKRYREEQIKRISDELLIIEQKVEEHEKDIALIQGRLEALNNEFMGIPSNKDIITAASQVKEAIFNYDMSSNEVMRKTEEERKLYKELKKLKEKVVELTHNIPMKAELELYEEALDAVKEYRDCLYELEKVHGQVLQISVSLEAFKQQKEEVLEDIDNVLYDINIIERKLREGEINHDNLEKQLAISDYDTIKKELDECIKLLRELPDLKIKMVRKSESEKANLNRSQEKLENVEKELKRFEKLSDYYEYMFKEECELGYSVELKEDEDFYKLAKRLVKEADSQLKSNKDKEDYINVLYQRFQENNQYLRENSVRIDNIFNEDMKEDPELIRAEVYRKRLDIVAKVRGKEVSFYKFIDFIIEGIEEGEKLLKESDRQLFEDILVKNISKKIRAKIFHSEKWVNKMNELMEAMNTSSGLSFSLKWSSKKAEAEEQLDTKELVELLKQDGSLMKEEDLNKLSEHFRSKIAEARRAMEDKGQSQTFHTIMKDILDYRKWFEFKLFFVKTGQNKRELTNNAFFKFSGGEKAMAMYVPLFSAVYARYEGARKDCPRIISLDEAFAGVDEKNISDMFRLLGELGLDYIINSQILWGDYATVPALSICELIRPDNADFVTVIRYSWNGKVKELVV